jgi:hypothetical protein
MFLILPAIAWDHLGFYTAIKKGLAITKAHIGEFTAGFLMTELAAAIIFLPPGLLFLITDNFRITLPESVWVMTMIYAAFAWSFSIYLEQMFSAELYLWNKRWEAAVMQAQQQGITPPDFKDIPQPSLLEGTSHVSVVPTVPMPSQTEAL